MDSKKLSLIAVLLTTSSYSMAGISGVNTYNCSSDVVQSCIADGLLFNFERNTCMDVNAFTNAQELRQAASCIDTAIKTEEDKQTKVAANTPTTAETIANTDKQMRTAIAQAEVTDGYREFVNKIEAVNLAAFESGQKTWRNQIGRQAVEVTETIVVSETGETQTSTRSFIPKHSAAPANVSEAIVITRNVHSASGGGDKDHNESSVNESTGLDMNDPVAANDARHHGETSTGDQSIGGFANDIGDAISDGLDSISDGFGKVGDAISDAFSGDDEAPDAVAANDARHHGGVSTDTTDQGIGGVVDNIGKGLSDIADAISDAISGDDEADSSTSTGTTTSTDEGISFTDIGQVAALGLPGGSIVGTGFAAMEQSAKAKAGTPGYGMAETTLSDGSKVSTVSGPIGGLVGAVAGLFGFDTVTTTHGLTPGKQYSAADKKAIADMEAEAKTKGEISGAMAAGDMDAAVDGYNDLSDEAKEDVMNGLEPEAAEALQDAVDAAAAEAAAEAEGDDSDGDDGNDGDGGGVGGGAGPNGSDGPGGNESGSRCFAAGTPILMADGSEKNIEDIQLNDEVKAFEGFNDLENRKVIKLFKHEDATLVLINGEIKTTAEHPFLAEDGTFKEVHEFSVGDNMVKADGTLVEIKSLETLEGKHTVFNFTVDDLHTYIAKGVRVHNKI